MSSITTRGLKSSMKVLLRISNNRTDLADMLMLLLNSGLGNNSSRGNMVDSIALYCYNTIVSKCVRPFSHHDFSFPLARVVVPGIQSTSSLPLDGSTSAVVPSPILISVSESKFQSFPSYGCILHLMSTVFRHFLGH